jgi:hypothetical protein
MLKTLSPLLFFAPDIHLKNIEEVWIDQTVLQEPWKDFIDSLVHEWEGFVLYVSFYIPFLIDLYSFSNLLLKKVYRPFECECRISCYPRRRRTGRLSSIARGSGKSSIHDYKCWERYHRTIARSPSPTQR